MAGLSDTGAPAWRIVPQGDRTLLLVFGDQIDIETGRRCAQAAAALQAAGIQGLSDIVPTFNTVALHLQPCQSDADTRFQQLEAKIQNTLSQALTASAHAGASRQIDIPVCYGGDYGPDLGTVAEHCGLSPEDVVRLHSHRPAYVFMLGFAPGAPYIGVHDERLAIGRRATPRTVVPAGSVAIANLQTMIYPNASPGGWHIIGATPAVLFDPGHEPPTLLAPGDTVNFVPVSPARFQALKGKAA